MMSIKRIFRLSFEEVDFRPPLQSFKIYLARAVILISIVLICAISALVVAVLFILPGYLIIILTPIILTAGLISLRTFLFARMHDRLLDRDIGNLHLLHSVFVKVRNYRGDVKSQKKEKL